MEKAGRQPRVLIVDDEPMARDTLEALLFKEGYELLFAHSGIDALERITMLQPDVILLDVMMPGMTGFEVCQHLKHSSEWRHIPIILITALDSPEDLMRGLEAGADEFLSKPVNGLGLRARVRSMLRIKQQYDDLQRALALRELLSNMIVHDMRNPLAAIILYIQLVSRQLPESHASAPFLDLLNKEARQLSDFLDDMLMMAKMEQGKLVLSRSQVDMKEVALNKKTKYVPIANSQKVQFEVKVTDEIPIRSLDLNLIKRVLDNLITNALKFSPEDTTLTLWIDKAPLDSPLAEGIHLEVLDQDYIVDDDFIVDPDDRIRIRVIDQGPGIPPEDLNRIFNTFEVVDMKQSGKPQLGLGLAFCRLVSEAHGGRIFAGNNPDRGAVMTVEL